MPMPHVAALALLALTPADEPSFRDRVAPILERRCLACHNDVNPKGKLSLATDAGLRRGGEGGPAVEPGHPDESAIVEKIAGAKPEMPRNAPPLGSDEVETIRLWVAAGAHWPDGVTLRDRRADRGPWWSLLPLRRPEIPSPRTAGWARNPIDAFILDSLEAKGLPPSPRGRSPHADPPRHLRPAPACRRRPEEVEAFVADRSADAYERLVDRLLASPALRRALGAGTGSTSPTTATPTATTRTSAATNAWPYRDYVIRVLQRRQAVRPVRPRAARRRRALCPATRDGDHRDRLHRRRPVGLRRPRRAARGDGRQGEDPPPRPRRHGDERDRPPSPA